MVQGTLRWGTQIPVREEVKHQCAWEEEALLPAPEPELQPTSEFTLAHEFPYKGSFYWQSANGLAIEEDAT